MFATFRTFFGLRPACRKFGRCGSQHPEKSPRVSGVEVSGPKPLTLRICWEEKNAQRDRKTSTRSPES